MDAQTPPTHYFIKEILSNPIRLPSGRGVPWFPIGDDTGGLVTNDSTLIDELSNAAKRQVGGILMVSEAEFEDAKKKSAEGELRKLYLFKANNRSQAPRLAGDIDPAVEVKPLNKPSVSPSGQPIATPQSLPIPVPKARRRSVLMQSDDPEEIAQPVHS